MWNNVQCCVAAWMGGEFGGEQIHVYVSGCMAEALHCSSETTTTSLTCYTPTQNIKFKVWGENKNKKPPVNLDMSRTSPGLWDLAHQTIPHSFTRKPGIWPPRPRAHSPGPVLPQPKTLSCFLCLTSTVHPSFTCHLPSDLPRPGSYMSSVLLSLHGFTSWSIKIQPFEFWFSLVQLLSCVRLFATPWTAACQASLSITNSWSLLKLMSIESVKPSNHLILCHALLLPSSIFPSIRVFSNESVHHIRWSKYWSFSISPSNEYSGLISFRFER